MRGKCALLTIVYKAWFLNHTRRNSLINVSELDLHSGHQLSEHVAS